ncbi:magnesium transporter CorA [Loigolactobacillus backii]|uniref:magnesium transporter CorA family protein n=1 Tax=Loigolactobacillus backii TaxID=375175 RepID=UPI0007F120DE|nr:magnesium transporter CorA family protein [Loigolactobacillus backii]ANK58891.1 magnesium transporter CorA [Loigolactobacillus backii]ANK63881.1 magnesium transporter CorA [Loigolactobacillus backii]ANK66328.1 magnesium transporter CorA [Loigolactobacillus backii]OLF69320.1 magnesium transporter CorA [Loigolactobacillus backii]PIO88473.1 magnesium transporter CorA [Loigolactobacillus backii]
MINAANTLNNYKWIETEKLTAPECVKLKQQYGLTDEMITYVTDKDENPHYVYDADENIELFIVHVPYILDLEQLRYITRPVSFLIHQGTLFTFNESGLDWVNAIFKTVKQNPEIKRNDSFVLRALFSLMDSYISIIKAITKRRNQLDKLLNKNARNKDLLALSYLRQTLTFFSSAAQSNLDLLDELPKTYFSKVSDQTKKEMLEDATIEAEQVRRMITIETQVVDRIADTFDSIVNNNMNDTMKVLTIWSLTMAVPTIITGFYGMNVHLPLAKLGGAWLFIIALSLALVVWLLIALKVHRQI